MKIIRKVIREIRWLLYQPKRRLLRKGTVIRSGAHFAKTQDTVHRELERRREEGLVR